MRPIDLLGPGFPYLSTILFAPFVGAILIMLAPRRALVLMASYDWTKGGFRFQELYDWIPELGITVRLGVDGISTPMVLLTGLVIFTGSLISWKIADRPKEYFALLLVLVTGVFGVFVSLDLFALFFAYEIAVLPMYLLIAVWGSTRKDYAAMKLTMMLVAGSILIWVVILALFVQTGAKTFDIETFASPAMQRLLPATFQIVFFPMAFIGFGVLAGMWPFHTWSPDGHVAAPTAVSMLHA